MSSTSETSIDEDERTTSEYSGSDEIAVRGGKKVPINPDGREIPQYKAFTRGITTQHDAKKARKGKRISRDDKQYEARSKPALTIHPYTANAKSTSSPSFKTKRKFKKEDSEEEEEISEFPEMASDGRKRKLGIELKRVEREKDNLMKRIKTGNAKADKIKKVQTTVEKKTKECKALFNNATCHNDDVKSLYITVQVELGMRVAELGLDKGTELGENEQKILDAYEETLAAYEKKWPYMKARMMGMT